MGIFRKSMLAIHWAFPNRTLVTNRTEEYLYDREGRRKLIMSRDELITWTSYSDRIEICKENGDISIHKVYLDRDRSRIPQIVQLRYSESYGYDVKNTFICITNDEISIGNNIDHKEEIFKVIKDTWS